MVYQEDEQSGGKKKVVRAARKPMRRPMRAAPKKAAVGKRVFHNKLMKHFGGFFAELEGFAEQMDKSAGPGTGGPASSKARFTNAQAMPSTMPPMGPSTSTMSSTKPPMPPMHSSSSQAQDGGRPRRKVVPKKKVAPKKVALKKKMVMRRSRGGSSEEEFISLKDAMDVTNSFAKPVADGVGSIAQSLPFSSGNTGGAPRLARRAYRASSPMNRPVVRRRRAASPRRK